MVEHHIKIEGTYFDAVVDGKKTFEIRKNDRNYQCGDVLVLHEVDQEAKHTGQSIVKEVVYLSDYMQQEGYVVLAIAKPTLNTLLQTYSHSKALLLQEGYNWHVVTQQLSESEAKQEVAFWEY